jgi:hypothetical protein
MRAADLTRLLAVMLVAVLVTGCSHWRDRRDAPWDPRGGSLLEQIPNEEGGSDRRCGGHLSDEERRRSGKSPRC